MTGFSHSFTIIPLPSHFLKLILFPDGPLNVSAERKMKKIVWNFLVLVKRFIHYIMISFKCSFSYPFINHIIVYYRFFSLFSPSVFLFAVILFPYFYFYYYSSVLAVLLLAGNSSLSQHNTGFSFQILLIYCNTRRFLFSSVFPFSKTMFLILCSFRLNWFILYGRHSDNYVEMKAGEWNSWGNYVMIIFCGIVFLLYYIFFLSIFFLVSIF